MRKTSATRGGKAKFIDWIGDIVGNPRYLAYAILVHVAFIALLVFSLDWSSTPAPTPTVNIVEAVVIDEAKVLAEMEKLRKSEARKKKQALDAKKKRQQEERRLAELKKKRVAEQRKLKEQEKKRQVETKRVAELKEKRKVEQRKLKEQEKINEKQARLAALKKEEEALDKKHKQEEKKRRQQAEKELQQQLAMEQDAEREKKARTVVAQYVGLIKQKVERNWLRPTNSKQGLSCEVLVRLIPGGEVVDVRITESSGDPNFDSSVERAVEKASPLPLPNDSSMFPYFRELKFIFNPEG